MVEMCNETCKNFNVPCTHDFNMIPIVQQHFYKKIDNVNKYILKKTYGDNKNQGIIFVWPRRKKFYIQRKRTIFVWFIAQCLYCLHIFNFWPSGTALFLNKPAWEYKEPLLKPETHDYIIEPDWDSAVQ